MSPSRTPDNARPLVADVPATRAPAPPDPPRRRTRKRFWLLLALAAVVSLLPYPPAWHGALRALLTWQAGRQGCELSIGSIRGGPFDTFDLYDVRCRQRGLAGNLSRDGDGTDLRAAHASITLAWELPGGPHPAPSWVRQLTLEGVSGQWSLTPGRHHAAPSAAARWFDLNALAARFVPADFLLRADDATLRRWKYFLRVRGGLLTGVRDGEGRFTARAVEAAGPRFDATLPDQHGRTFWQGERLTLSDLDLGHGVRLARATLDGARLGRQRLDWEGELRALGGSVRGQGAVNFSRERLALEVGGSVQRIALGPLARLLEVTGPADGQVERASFSFRGDPENWPAAEMWLAGRATDFRWGTRRWESLDVQAVVTNRRVQVHRLELRQSRNRLSLDGECGLPPAPSAAAPGRWWQAEFACNVDARLEDLGELARLFGPPAPDLAGRMSINGRLGARAGTQGFDGYLNVEGSGLRVRGAPLDFLRSTLLFRGEELDVADLQATRGGDYLAGHGSMHIAGPPEFQALGRVSVDDPGIYAPAYAGLLPEAYAGGAPVRALTAGVRLEGSTLYLDQCQGEQNGSPFYLGGSVDLSDTAHPLLDLSLVGEQAPRAADPADADAAWRAGILYTLKLQGPPAGPAAIRGDVRLLHGHFDRALDPLPPDAAALMQPLLRRLPGAWRDWPLDLHVTAADPLPSGESDHVGTVMPDLEITGTGREPRLDGKLGFQSVAAGPEQAGGAWYFSADAPENPTLSMTVTENDGRRGTFLFGPGDERQTVSWDLAESGGELTLQPVEIPPQIVEDASPWAEWIKPLMPARPRLFIDGPRPTSASFSGF